MGLIVFTYHGSLQWQEQSTVKTTAAAHQAYSPQDWMWGISTLKVLTGTESTKCGW